MKKLEPVKQMVIVDEMYVTIACPRCRNTTYTIQSNSVERILICNVCGSFYQEVSVNNGPSEI